MNVSDTAERKLKENFKVQCMNNTERLLDIIFLSVEEIFDVIRDVHLATSYGDPGRILHKVKKKYANVIRLAVKAFIELCESCQRKQKTTNRKRLVVKPIIYLTMLRCYLKDNPDVPWSDALKFV
ncbi:KRAB-A domain-containing protein 2 [Trichinella pseudospiralis]|uniref:KRAB-A domain-containing protein 2 n=1 Tax=Trichinella pseudospiralis TaxID=6337 RepID=A0A0V1KD08_TRIPS|nr:KRAB-A domain-containing protein 2 [Trichinella pseudospiralis]